MGKLLFYIPLIAIVMAIYSFLNFYYVYKIKKAFEIIKYPLWSELLILFMIISPILLLILERNEKVKLPAMLGGLSYIWLTMLFIFTIFHLDLDILGFIFNKIGLRFFSPRVSWIIVHIAALFIVIYGLFDARKIIMERIEFRTDKLAKGTKLRIIQVSDIHFSSITGSDFAKKVVDLINIEKPDIIVSTGDIVDRGIKSVDKICEELKKLQSKFGFYGVTGNHEYYYGLGKAKKFHEKCNIKLIRNEVIEVGGINLAGVDDKTAKRFYDDIIPDGENLLKGLTGYTVFLKHQPKVSKKTFSYFDLMLSGHTHGGQLFPFNAFVKLVFPYFSGPYKEMGSTLYVNRGTGTWGPPIRFLSTPEITVIDIIGK